MDFKKSIALFSLSLIPAAVFAAQPLRVIVAPKCLLKKSRC